MKLFDLVLDVLAYSSHLLFALAEVVTMIRLLTFLLVIQFNPTDSVFLVTSVFMGYFIRLVRPNNTLFLDHYIYTSVVQSAFSQVKHSGLNVWLLWAGQSSFMVYIYHIYYLIAIHHVHTSELIEVSTIIWVKKCQLLISSDVWIAVLYNVCCRAAGYLAIEKTTITRGNSLQKHDFQSGVWVGVGGGVEGLRMLFNFFDSFLLGPASSTISWKSAW